MSTAHLLQPIFGRELLQSFTDQYANTLEEYIASTPYDALEKIKRKYTVVPSISGRNSEQILNIREAISRYSCERDLGYAFMIVAPHTHWRKRLPILISFDGNNYVLSEEIPAKESMYFPVSFAFTASGLLPYEWIDDTVSLPLKELTYLWKCAKWVATEVLTSVSGFGISINYRFKNPTDRTIVSTIEFQGLHGEQCGRSIVAPADRVEEDFVVAELEQVAWHALKYNCDGLSESEKACFMEIRELIDNIPSSKLRMLLCNRLLDKV